MPLSDEDKAIRLTGIGASEAPAICGVDLRKTPLDVWWSKPTASRKPVHTIVEGDAVEAGNELEDGIARMYARRRKVELVSSPTLRHPSMPWVLATPDRRIVGEQRGIQAKLVGPRMAHHWHDGPPDYVRVQVVQEMAVCDALSWDVVALIGTTLRIWTIDRNLEIESGVLELVTDFWHNHVLADIAPNPINEDDRRRDFMLRYPLSRDEMLEAPTGADAIVERALAAKARENAAKAEHKAAINDLLALLGDARGMKAESWTFSAPSIPGKVDWKAVAEELAGGDVPLDLLKKHGSDPFRRPALYPKKVQ